MQWRPPLADQLFDMTWRANVIDHFPRAKPVITHLLPQVGGSEPGSVERVLERLQSEAAAGDDERYRQLAAVQFYLQAMLVQCTWYWATQTTKGVTNYRTLIDEIRRLKETVCLVTFNYDTLLEEALSTFGLKFNSMSDYTSSNYKVIKIHGSVNWAHEVNTVENTRGRNQLQIATEIIDRRPQLQISKSYEIVAPTMDEIMPGYPMAKSGERAVLPALAVPVENKPGDEIPPEHYEVLTDYLPQVSKILVIGWRANESRFLTTLAEGIGNRQPRFMIVSGSPQSASEIGIRIGRRLHAGVGVSFKVAKGGFTSAIRNREIEAFLKS